MGIRQINLLPLQMQRAEKTRMISHIVVTTFLPVFLFLFLIHFLLVTGIDMSEKTAAAPAAPEESAEITRTRQEIAGLKIATKTFMDKNQDLLKQIAKTYPSFYILQNIGVLSSDKVWLNGFSLDNQKGLCRINGKSFNTRLVSEFMLELKRLPFFENVELISMGKEGASKSGEIDFEIVCNLR